MNFEVKYRPLPAQKLFHNSPAKFRCLAGGFGSAKTLTGIAEAFTLSTEYPNNLGLVGRETFPELRDSTRKDFLDFPLIIDGKEVRLEDSPLIKNWNKTENQLDFRNGSTILFRPLDSAFKKIKSLNLGWYWVDEGTETSEEVILGLNGRLRRKGVRRTGFITTNPEGRDHIWKTFIANADEVTTYGEPPPDEILKLLSDAGQFEIPRRLIARGKDTFLVSAYSFDNPYLPEGYVRGLIEKYPFEWVKRYVFGSFDTFEGLVYKEFQDKEPVVVPDNTEIPDHWYRFVAVDHGYRNPAVVLWLAVSPQGVVYVYDEFYASGKLVSDIATVIKTKKQDVQLYLIDPSCRNRSGTSGRSVMDEFSDNGIYFEPANNDVRAGINHVQEYFKAGKLRILRRCVNLRTELQTYRWKDLRPSAIQDAPEKPLKKNDHAVDALRYGINYLYDTPLPKPQTQGWKKWLGIEKVTEENWKAA